MCVIISSYDMCVCWFDHSVCIMYVVVFIIICYVVCVCGVHDPCVCNVHGVLLSCLVCMHDLGMCLIISMWLCVCMCYM